ncbi:hypothetical protein ABIB40_003022 [Pedobacter sp. UYP30]
MFSSTLICMFLKLSFVVNAANHHWPRNVSFLKGNHNLVANFWDCEIASIASAIAGAGAWPLYRQLESIVRHEGDLEDNYKFLNFIRHCCRMPRITISKSIEVFQLSRHIYRKCLLLSCLTTKKSC